MATRVFADEELQRLREFPEISREELFRYFTLTPADLAFVAPQGRGPAVRLGPRYPFLLKGGEGEGGNVVGVRGREEG